MVFNCDNLDEFVANYISLSYNSRNVHFASFLYALFADAQIDRDIIINTCIYPDCSLHLYKLQPLYLFMHTNIVLLVLLYKYIEEYS